MGREIRYFKPNIIFSTCLNFQNPFCMFEVNCVAIGGNKVIGGRGYCWGCGQIKKHYTESYAVKRGERGKVCCIQVFQNSKSFAKRSSHFPTPRPPGFLQETCKLLQDSEMVMKILPLNRVELTWNVPQGCGLWECKLKSRGFWAYLVAGFWIFKPNWHIPMPFPCCFSAIPCCINSHLPCRAPGILRQCRVLHQNLCGSWNYPNC
jgi:hypothetical protein